MVREEGSIDIFPCLPPASHVMWPTRVEMANQCEDGCCLYKGTAAPMHKLHCAKERVLVWHTQIYRAQVKATAACSRVGLQICCLCPHDVLHCKSAACISAANLLPLTTLLPPLQICCMHLYSKSAASDRMACSTTSPKAHWWPFCSPTASEWLTTSFWVALHLLQKPSRILPLVQVHNALILHALDLW